MKQTISFWLFQIGIWGSLTSFNLLARGYFTHYKLGELVNSLSLFVALLAASSFLKMFYRDQVSASIPKGVGQAILGSAAASCIAIFIVGLILLPNQQYLFGEVGSLPILQLVASFPTIFIFLLCWSAVYLLLKRQQSLKLAYRREAELRQALASSQMDLLINQLNPHFMFNVINNIRALILEDTDKARDSLAQLSEVLRTTLQTKQDKVWSLPQEIDLTKSFIQLNKLQFESRLEVVWNVSGNIEKWQVPCLALQLLVENAIKHGIGALVYGGTVTINIIADNNLSIEVVNPGNLTPSKGSTSLGITNIKQRLNLLYADRAYFSLTENQHQVSAKIVIKEDQ
ncbi:hypothetical protein GTH32_05020 [Alteromonas sp. 345S023]|uniref:Signal transduction histidine kinase internal region domain-containing protein n=1 Tax=Alteromonas profundi TaxID=2696062 RepID=A0A7X5RK31_9ALTE|nr:histidine kinase [Alteromonas profundi]NDV90558.1 hypothetical protein [Alteromonas profundi]